MALKGFLDKKRETAKKVKDSEPVYVPEAQVEIDFYLNNHVLVEVKFEEDIKDRQKEFFEKFKAKHKRVIKGFQDLDELEALLQKTRG
jgi:hypothetical protein